MDTIRSRISGLLSHLCCSLNGLMPQLSAMTTSSTSREVSASLSPPLDSCSTQQRSSILGEIHIPKSFLDGKGKNRLHGIPRHDQIAVKLPEEPAAEL